jgi:hypothetical protein
MQLLYCSLEFNLGIYAKYRPELWSKKNNTQTMTFGDGLSPCTNDVRPKTPKIGGGCCMLDSLSWSKCSPAINTAPMPTSWSVKISNLQLNNSKTYGRSVTSSLHPGLSLNSRHSVFPSFRNILIIWWIHSQYSVYALSGYDCDPLCSYTGVLSKIELQSIVYL